MRMIDTESIKKILFNKCMSITDLAKKTDISLVSANRIVNGKAFPRATTLKKICVVLKCKPQDITKEVEENE